MYQTLAYDPRTGDWRPSMSTVSATAPPHIDKSVLITGGFGNLGTACVAQAHALNWQAVAISRITGHNLSDWQATDAYFNGSRAYTPDYDLVIVAHGTHRIRRIAEMTECDWNYVVDNSLTSVASLTSALIKHNRLQPNALLVYAGSIQAQHARTGRAAYAAARAGIEGYMRACAAELKGYARAVCLRMGQFDVQMDGVKFSDEERKQLQDRCYAPWLKPSDVAKFIWSLYEQPGMTGCCIDFDSGQSANVW
jgi:NAD(P)-dependent dehydrogenase (short-subunit alcohol dehydrogenase family)